MTAGQRQGDAAAGFGRLHADADQGPALGGQLADDEMQVGPRRREQDAQIGHVVQAAEAFQLVAQAVELLPVGPGPGKSIGARQQALAQDFRRRESGLGDDRRGGGAEGDDIGRGTGRTAVSVDAARFGDRDPRIAADPKHDRGLRPRPDRTRGAAAP